MNPVPVKDTNMKVPKLKEGEPVQFRVKAVNEAGPGKPSRPTEAITPETQPGNVIGTKLLKI